MTAVEWLEEVNKKRELDKFDFEQAKVMEEEREYQIKAIWYGIGINAGRTNKVAELRPWKKNDPRKDTLNEK